MSLINDALKRAKQSQKMAPGGAVALPPVQSSSRGGLGWGWPLVVILLLASGGFFIGLAVARHKAPGVETAAAESLAAVTVEAAPSSMPSPAAPALPAAEPVVVTATPVSTPPPVAMIAAPSSPSLKLQAIFLDPQKPWAIVSGRTVYAGDRVDEFRVKAISQNAVTLERADGSQRKLGLGETLAD